MKSYFNAQRSKYGLVGSDHGFCMCFNVLINHLEYHNDRYNNFDVLIENQKEISDIFDIKQIDNNHINEYTNDLVTDFANNPEYHNLSSSRNIINMDHLYNKNIIYEKFFSMRDIDFFINEINKYVNDKTLGIHLRGTDGDQRHRIGDEKNICLKIERLLYENELNSIFLATDDIFYQNMLVSNFGNIVKFRKENIISENGKPFFYDNADRTIVNKEVVLDLYLLANCKYFLYSFSNVSYTALTIGYKNFLKIETFE